MTTSAPSRLGPPELVDAATRGARLAVRILAERPTSDGLAAAMCTLDDVDHVLDHLTMAASTKDTAERVRRARDSVSGLLLAARTCEAAGASRDAVARLLHRAAHATTDLMRGN